MPVIDVDKARAWAKERWPSPVVRRHVDDLLAHCPRTKEIPVIRCKDCRHSVIHEHLEELYLCRLEGKPNCPTRIVYGDSTCDDAAEREESAEYEKSKKPCE